MALLAAGLVIVVGGLAVVLPAFVADFIAERLATARFARAVAHDELEHMLRDWLGAQRSQR